MKYYRRLAEEVVMNKGHWSRLFVAVGCALSVGDCPAGKDKYMVAPAVIGHFPIQRQDHGAFHEAKRRGKASLFIVTVSRLVAPGGRPGPTALS
jgi:hypothetical protein